MCGEDNGTFKILEEGETITTVKYVFPVMMHFKLFPLSFLRNNEHVAELFMMHTSKKSSEKA